MSLNQSVTDVANMALSHLGTGKEIADLNVEKSQEAAACRRFFDTAVQSVLESFDWSFARRVVALALVQDNTLTGTIYPAQWRYLYRYPGNCASVRSIISICQTRIDDSFTAVPWEMQTDSTGNLICTDLPNAAVRFTSNQVPVQQWPANFSLAVSLYVASMIAPRLTAGDPQGLGGKAFQKYGLLLSMAQADNINQSQVDRDRQAELAEVRDL